MSTITTVRTPMATKGSPSNDQDRPTRYAYYFLMATLLAALLVFTALPFIS